MHNVLRGRALSFLVLGLFLLVPSAGSAQSNGKGRGDAAKPVKPPKPCNPRKSACPDTTAPSVAITAPDSGSTVRGSVTVSGTASDNVAVNRVEVQVDDGAFQLATGTGSWSFSFDSAAFADGSHSIRARAADAAGNLSALGAIALTFSNSTDPDVLGILEVRLDRPTLHALGVQVLITGDENRNARVAVRYRRSGDASWTEGLPLLRVMPETITETVPQQFAGSVFDLDPATTYEIELRATDLDGAVDVTDVVSGTTRGVPVSDPLNPRTVPVSTATGLRAALAAAQPGDVILVAPGTYDGTYVMSASGTATRPIVIRGSGDGGAILDGNNCSSCNVLEVGGSYVHVEQLTIVNAVRGLRFTGVDATGNVARRLTIGNVVHGTASMTGQTDFYICDNTLDGRLQWPWALAQNASTHWDDRGIEVTGDGHVVCHNSIRGFGDPVVNRKRLARSWDIYGNDIADAFDGVEMDEGAGNVRLFHNRFTNVMAPVSIQPMFGGPGYVLRNVAFNVPDEQVKLKSLGGVEEPSGVFVYHNTFVSPERALNLLSTITQHNFVFANNLFVGPDLLWDPGRTVDWRAGINAGTFDYNGYYPDGGFMFGTVAGVDRLFSSFTQVQAAGVETHGVLLFDSVFQAGFVGPSDETIRHSPPDFTLAAGSNAIDRGARLPGVNDGFAGSAPDLGALERGCPLPVYGPRPAGQEGGTSRINCAPGSAAMPTK